MIAVLQFDAASAAVLQRMGAEGRLPNLEALRARGRKVDLQGPADHFPASAYQTLYRGVEVADHGLFYPFQWSAEEQRVRRCLEGVLGIPATEGNRIEALRTQCTERAFHARRPRGIGVHQRIL